MKPSVRNGNLVAALSACFGALATLLAAVGLYGVMAYMVVRRTREIGIRMALGAGRREVLRLVMKEVVVLGAVGIGIAILVSLAMGRLIESQTPGSKRARSVGDQRGDGRSGTGGTSGRVASGTSGNARGSADSFTLRIRARLTVDPRPGDPILGNRRRGIPMDANQVTPQQPLHAGLNSAFGKASRIGNRLMTEACAPFPAAYRFAP